MIDESLVSHFEMEPIYLDHCSVTIGPFTASRYGDGRVLVELEMPHADASIVMVLSPEVAAQLSRLLAHPEELPICCCCEP